MEKFLSLSAIDKKKVHISMAELALKTWKNFLDKNEVPLSYYESVASTHQQVDTDLPARALEAVKSKSNGLQISNDYLEPIVSLQDDDWAFNDEAQMAYYAIYNTFRKYVKNEKIDDGLIINQALSSLGSDADILTPLKHAIEQC